jgi:flagellar biosynthesis protein FlgN
MPAVDPALTRDHLARLLAEENSALAEFESLLDREHAALKTRDIDTLESLADARTSSVHRMLKLEDERRSVCSMLGYGTDLHGLSRLIAWCDPRGSLAGAYDECAGRARRCRDLNDRNGILVGAQIKRVEGMLGAITGNTAPAAYGPRGNAPRAMAAYGGNSGQVLSAEA